MVHVFVNIVDSGGLENEEERKLGVLYCVMTEGNFKTGFRTFSLCHDTKEVNITYLFTQVVITYQ